MKHTKQILNPKQRENLSLFESSLITLSQRSLSPLNLRGYNLCFKALSGVYLSLRVVYLPNFSLSMLFVVLSAPFDDDQNFKKARSLKRKQRLEVFSQVRVCYLKLSSIRFGMISKPSLEWQEAFGSCKSFDLYFCTRNE